MAQNTTAQTTFSALREQLLAEIGTTTTVEQIRLNGNDPTTIVPFTDYLEEVSLHYSELLSLPYTKCNGDGCVACKISNAVTKKYLMPVYLPLTKTIGVLPISESKKNGKLLPQILTKVTPDTFGYPMSITSLVQHTFGLVVHPSPLKDFDKLQEIEVFLEQLNSGSVKLDSIYKSMTNEELAQQESVKTRLEILGLA